MLDTPDRQVTDLVWTCLAVCTSSMEADEMHRFKKKAYPLVVGKIPAVYTAEHKTVNL